MPDPSWVVTGAGVSAANGSYTEAGTHNGSPYYTNESGWYLSDRLFGEVIQWVISASLDPTEYYTTESSTTLPANPWVAFGIAEPAPTLSAWVGGGDSGWGGGYYIAGQVTWMSAGIAVHLTVTGGVDVTASGAGTSAANGVYEPGPTSRGGHWNGTYIVHKRTDGFWYIGVTTDEEGTPPLYKSETGPPMSGSWTGWVVTNGESPAPSVSVSVRTAEVTDGNSSPAGYKFTGLVWGRYTVTPDSAEYTYAPTEIDEIDLPPSSDGNDFEATTASSSSSSSSGSSSSSSASSSSSSTSFSSSSSSSESTSSSSSSFSSSSSSFSSSSSSFSSSSSCSSSSSFSSSSSSSNSEPYRYYTYALPTLSSTAGTVVETRVRVTHSEGGVNQGAVISLFDGTHQFAVWMRADGVNLDGAADVPADMTDWRIVRLEAQGGYCHLYLDGVWQQGAAYMNTTTEKKAVFGTWVRL